MHQLQLIGIKTNLESFVTTTLMEQMLNRHQLHLFLWVSKQWGLGNPSINFPIAFPKECFIAAITRAAGNYEHSIVITTKNKTNLSWICKGYDNSAGNTYANWLALGC